MYCRTCGENIGNAASCPRCKAIANSGGNYCNYCGKEVRPTDAACPACGNIFSNGQTQGYPGSGVPEQKSRLAAGLFGIFLGGFGVHNFYLGYTSTAVLQIVVTFITCGIGSIWGFIDGIRILAKDINTDANGVPLRD